MERRIVSVCVKKNGIENFIITVCMQKASSYLERLATK